MKLNQNYRQLKESYLFSEIAQRVSAFQQNNPDRTIIRLGIGDVTRPLPQCVSRTMAEASAQMGEAGGFHGYGPEQGYPFLRELIAGYYGRRGVTLADREIFVSDGAKSDLGNILDLFDRENTALVPDPVYPVYVDSNLMDGREIRYLNATAENGFLPLPDESQRADLIYLCSPNNPTGAVYNREQLQKWVDYALDCGAILLFDAAYESFIQDESIPHSIFEIPGAKKCAIEFCSLSKMAGFTGTRCGWTVVPLELEREGMQLNHMWLRRQCTKFNGVSYPVQAAAAAVFTPAGLEEAAENIRYYRENARLIAAALKEKGIPYTGGENSPYIWHQCPNGMSSWEYFDFLLNQAGVVGTPGEGFGKNGEGYFRLTSFGTREGTEEAIARIKALL